MQTELNLYIKVNAYLSGKSVYRWGDLVEFKSELQTKLPVFFFNKLLIKLI